MTTPASLLTTTNGASLNLLHRRLNSNLTNFPADVLVNNEQKPFIGDLHICKVVLYSEILDTSIRIWDFIIFIPNFFFLIYLIWHSRVSKERVRQLTNFPILRNFYIFIYLCVIISIFRCIISSLMKVRTIGGDVVDKVSWVVVRFFLLSTEISVLVFGLFSGHLDVRQSIRRILTITLVVSLVYSICQGSFEIISPDDSFYIHSKSYYLFGHGGMIFWFCTCFLSFFIYLIVVLLPWSPCRHRFLLPTKRSFYFYAATLSILNLIQAIGALLFYLNVFNGLCIVDATTYLYFTLFTPLVYFIFLSPFLAVGSSQSAAAALVTTTAGVESSHNQNRPIVPLTRPTNLFNSGLRGAVNFSYRPQIDDELLDNEDEFASSVGSFTGGGLHFDHYGPYAYNGGGGGGGQTPRQGYLIYSGNHGGNGLPRDFSSFSLQTTAATLTPSDVSTMLLDNQQQQHHFDGLKKKHSGVHHTIIATTPTTTTITTTNEQSMNNDNYNNKNGKDQRLLESHMLQEKRQPQQQSDQRPKPEKIDEEVGENDSSSSKFTPVIGPSST